MSAILHFDKLPAYHEARRRDQALRDREFLGSGYQICGIRIRPMSLRDLQLLEELRSPFLFRREPTTRELVFFLWLLSPAIAKWHDEKGWRKQWLLGCRLRLFSLEFWQSVFHGWKCRRILGSQASRRQQWAAAAKQCFEYIDTMFRDGPKGGGESQFSYLAGWCDLIRSEYKCSEDEVFTMPLPKLWQVMRAIQKRKDPSITFPSPECDRLRMSIIKGVNSGKFTLDDFAAGKVTWDGKEWRN